MDSGDQHLSDEEILRLIDGELPAREAARVQEHLRICPACRGRRAAVEGMSEALGELYRLELRTMTSSAAASRLHLEAEIANAHLRKNRPDAVLLRLALAAAVAGILVLACFGGLRPWKHPRAAATAEAALVVPDRSLTPGALRPIALDEVCSARDSSLDPQVPPATAKAVLAHYGIRSAQRTEEYQIDYLVNPQLGGTGDIRNLWPQVASGSRWNARAKDDLERRLQQMVCERKLDLAVAQREIATNWIAAYKRYVSGNPS